MEANPYYGGKMPASAASRLTVASGDLCTAQLRPLRGRRGRLHTGVPRRTFARSQGRHAGQGAEALPGGGDGLRPVRPIRTRRGTTKVRYALAFAIDRKAV